MRDSIVPHRKLVVLLFMAILVPAPVVLFAGGVTQSRAATGQVATVTVIGQGELFAEPDQASITIGLQLYDESAQVASQRLSERMEAVIEAMRALGIPDNRIQTRNYSIFFERDYQSPLSARGEDGQPPGIYRVENTMRLVLSDVDAAASAIEAAVRAGANQMYGIDFSFSDPASLDARARTLAMANARSRAEALAAAVGASVGRAVRITELIGSGSGESHSMETALRDSQIQPGSTRYLATVQVTYELE
jgi:uncharacterized protein